MRFAAQHVDFAAKADFWYGSVNDHRIIWSRRREKTLIQIKSVPWHDRGGHMAAGEVTVCSDLSHRG